MDRASERTRTWRDCGACSASRTTPDATQYSSVFMNQEPDIAIVGAGAAGIGAARRLARSGLSTVILEALPRRGGRAWTRQAAGVSLDLGCGWLHSADRNPWTRIAEETGFEVDRRTPAWRTQYRDLGFPAAEREAARDAFARWNKAACRHAAVQRLRRRPLAGGRRQVDALSPGDERLHQRRRARARLGEGLRRL